MAISAPILAALGGRTVYRAYYVVLNFASGTMRAWQGEGNITISGNTVYGLGRMGSVSAVEQPVNGAAPQVSISLSGLTTEVLLATISAESEVKGRACELRMAVWNTSGTHLGDIPILTGIMDRMVYSTSVSREDDKGTAVQMHTVSVTLESRLASRRLSPTNATYTQADQAARYPSDLGLQFAGTLQFKNYRWPVF